jgi:GAF domain-containing protein
MPGPEKEVLLARTFVEIVDTLVADFDVVDLLTMVADRCVEVLDVTAAGLMLVAPAGDLRVVAYSSEAVRAVELLELQSEEGPSLDAFRTGAAVVNHDLESGNGRWPRFAAKAIECELRSVHALPMRLRGVTIGALSLFRAHEGAMEESDVIAAQALADVATVAIIHHRAATEAQLVNEHFNHALNSRAVIEQAKDLVAERTGLDKEQAFARLRHHARNHNQRLVDVAHAVIHGTLKAEALDPPSSSR